MRAMGDKVTARQTMEKAGVPIVPGTTERLSDEEVERWVRDDRPAGDDQGERPAAAARACASCATQSEMRAGASRARAARPGLLRRRLALRREVRRGAAPHRDPDPRRPPRQRRAPLRARVLDPAPPPEGDRGGAGQRHHRRTCAREMGEAAVAAAQRRRLRGRRHLRVPGRRARPLLLPRDEHARAGRARRSPR